MLVLIGVTALSSAGWLASRFFARSAARRHVVLVTALAACMMLPLALAVRDATDWTLLTLRAPVAAEETAVKPIATEAVGRAERDSPPQNDPLTGGATAAIQTPPPAQPLVAEPAPPSPPQESPELASAPPAPAQRWSMFGTFRWRTAYAVVTTLLLTRLAVSLAVTLLKVRGGSHVDTLAGGAHVFEADVACPMAVGYGQRAILLPRGLRRSLSNEQLHDVLAHEATHLERRDHWVLFTQSLAAALFWPVVTVHLMNRALTRAREELCDNAVLLNRAPVNYAHTLFCLARTAGREGRLLSPVAPMISRGGAWESRVAGLLDGSRDRRTRTGRHSRWAFAITLGLLLVLVATTRVLAARDPEPDPTVADKPPVAQASPAITWTGVPKVARDNPVLHRGVVIGPDGEPLADASVYAASSLGLLDKWPADEVGVDHLGPVRAVTDAQGRFEFTAKDLSWVTPAGERKRRETLLVTTKEGFAPGWLQTWGADRGFHASWHPRYDKDVLVRMRPQETLTGRFLLEDGTPLAGGRVRLTGLMAPVYYDLDKHILKEEVNPPGMFQGVDYADTLYRPWVVPGLTTEAMTDDQGRFELPGLPEGFLTAIQFTHPEAMTTNRRVPVRVVEPFLRKPNFWENQQENPPDLLVTQYTSGFTAKVPKGVVLEGQVRVGNSPAEGVTVGLANQNSRTGMARQTFRTDSEGRFRVTGLYKRTEGYELAFVGSFDAPYTSTRQLFFPGASAVVKLNRAVRYRLKLVDPEGKPVDRPVQSIRVQKRGGLTVQKGIRRYFDSARRVAPGIYEGIVPTGPAAILVERSRSDRPAAVNPKEFFAPGRTDWTPAEERYAYGDTWRVADPNSGMKSQRDFAAIRFTNERSASDEVLELTATVHPAPPRRLEIVNEQGEPVVGARMRRQFEYFKSEQLPAEISVYGLHPDRAERFEFTHDELGLIGVAQLTWSEDPARVVMRPAAKVIGRITDAAGDPNYKFNIRLQGEAIAPDAYVAGRVYKPFGGPGKRRGEFIFLAPPGSTLRGEFVRKGYDSAVRPAAGPAFGPISLEPGVTVQLGDLVVP